MQTEMLAMPDIYYHYEHIHTSKGDAILKHVVAFINVTSSSHNTSWTRIRTRTRTPRSNATAAKTIFTNPTAPIGPWACMYVLYCTTMCDLHAISRNAKLAHLDRPTYAILRRHEQLTWYTRYLHSTMYETEQEL